jgi:hypothetical protein
MARQRAGQAKAAFARIGAAQLDEFPADQSTGDDASISASGNAGVIDINPDGVEDVSFAVSSDGKKAGVRAGRSAGRKVSKPRRRVGRPRGPDRVPLTIRILAETDDRLTVAVELTGESPQYIVDKALAGYLDALGITKPM